MGRRMSGRDLPLELARLSRRSMSRQLAGLARRDVACELLGLARRDVALPAERLPRRHMSLVRLYRRLRCQRRPGGRRRDAGAGSRACAAARLGGRTGLRGGRTGLPACWAGLLPGPRNRLGRGMGRGCRRCGDRGSRSRGGQSRCRASLPRDVRSRVPARRLGRRHDDLRRRLRFESRDGRQRQPRPAGVHEESERRRAEHDRERAHCDARDDLPCAPSFGRQRPVPPSRREPPSSLDRGISQGSDDRITRLSV